MATCNDINDDQFEKRREFSKRLTLRRHVFRELTVYLIFPLQAMAMDDFHKRLSNYYYSSNCFIENKQDSASDTESEASQRRQSQKQLEEVEASSSSSLLDCDRQLRDTFVREFHEASIHPSLVITSTAAPTNAHGNSEKTLFERQEENDQEVIDGIGLDVIAADTTFKNHETSKQSQHQPTAEPFRFNNALWSMEPRLFAMETSLKGKRRYISAHLGRFMDHYWRECDVYSRHYYELIREDTPCRLYFDLEFSKTCNPQLSPTIAEDFLTQLFDELCYQFEHSYNITLRRSDLVDLDASTHTKFSRHWIMHLPNGELFANAREVGIFVNGFISRLEEERESGELQTKGRDILAKNLFINADNNTIYPENGDVTKLTRIIDTGVYTRNRLFRLLGSTKFGKPPASALRIAKANQFPFPSGFHNSKFYLPEMSKTLLKPDDREDIVNDDFEKFCNALRWNDHADALSATLVIPANSCKIKFPILKDPSAIFTINHSKKSAMSTTIPLNGCVNTTKFPRATPLHGASPFPLLEKFIIDTVGKRGDVVGRISTWSIGTQQPLPRTISYSMKDNRFCENIGRAHKSNNIIWNVHLCDRICWQSCHDPECKGYRGKSIDLSEEVNMEIDEYFLEYELSLLGETVKHDERVMPGGCIDVSQSTLEEAMSKLCVSNAKHCGGGETLFDDASLDDELAKLNLSELLANNHSYE